MKSQSVRGGWRAVEREAEVGDKAVYLCHYETVASRS